MRARSSSIVYISFSCRTGDTLKIRVTGWRKLKTRGSGTRGQGGKCMGGGKAERRKERKGGRAERVRGGALNIYFFIINVY